jgi:hypothetical protein
MIARVEMAGRRFGTVTALRVAPEARTRTKFKWVCLCDCGQEFTTCGGKLRCGDVVSCPDCSRERVRLSRVVHGMRRTAEYRIWTHIKSRCFNTRVPEFKHYGGRGITMCERWRESFADFLADMGPRPSALHSVDRHPNNDGNYEPGNCRWATPKAQANNTRSNRKVTVAGETRNMTQWAESIGVRREVIHKRLKRGIEGDRLLAEPVKTEIFTFAGVSASIPEWSSRTGIKRATLYWRIKQQKWPLDRALTKGAST